MTAIIFANAAVLDGTSGECREDHHVLVELLIVVAGGELRGMASKALPSNPRRKLATIGLEPRWSRPAPPRSPTDQTGWPKFSGLLPSYQPPSSIIA